MKDYKDSLNLPRTDFPMKADLVHREPQRLQRWTDGRLYERIQAARREAPVFVLHDGPPFANGDVHIGTAFNKILKDIVIKSQTMRGRRAPYLPGWDCHGLPIEFKVAQELRQQAPSAPAATAAAAADTATIRSACEAYAWKYIDIQRRQFVRLGVLGDWSNPYLTLDRQYEAEELRLFADVVERGFVYRGKKPVYWSIPCRTALAEAEVEYKDHVSQSVYVKFPVVGHPATSLLIWTTTPWTLPANLAVAYNSTFSYSQIRFGGECYLVSTALLPQIAAKCGLNGYEIVRSLDPAQLGTLEYQHPFCARTGRLLKGDAFVDNTTGTGFVHMAPGHGLEDYLLGSQNGLPIYSPVDNDGHLAHTQDLPSAQQMPAAMTGKAILAKHGRSAANDAVIDALRHSGHLLLEEAYTHSYPHCWRSKTPVIFRAMDQWFIRIDHEPAAAAGSASAPPGPSEPTSFRQQALAAIQHVRWIPEWGQARIEAAVKARPDWCISRQRAWGVPIPAFFGPDHEPILDARVVRRAADLIAKHGSNIWFELSVEALWQQLRPDDWHGPTPAAKSTDTLDVWIDSGSSSRAVIAARPELRRAPGSDADAPAPAFQADLYLEGSDQHRGWFQSSLLLSLAGNGAPPYKAVLTHGFMVDAGREKISKSRQEQGASSKPQTVEAYLKHYGADVLRLWVASQDFRNDIVVSDDRIAKVAETYRLLRNTLRYQLSNLYDFDPATHAVPDHALTRLDRWILAQFAQLEQAVLEAYANYELHVVYQRLSQFAAVELSAIYHDLVKDRLYTDPAGAPRRRSTQTALHRLVTGLCQLLAPVLAFTTDEAWEFIPARPQPSVHETAWTHHGVVLSDEEQSSWPAALSLRDLVLAELEKARQTKTIGKALEARVALRAHPDLAAACAQSADELRELLNVSQVSIETDVAVPVERGWEISVATAQGQKCSRCWHWELDVGAHPEHPALCARCATAVAGALA
jgi:isoleucyl-tRNA synthetase